MKKRVGNCKLIVNGCKILIGGGKRSVKKVVSKDEVIGKIMVVIKIKS